MKPLKILFTSDMHLGLKTDDTDRTDEILRLVKSIISRGNKIQKEGKYDVIFVIGGDIFNTNTPSEFHIGAMIQIMNWIKKTNLTTYIIAGNHDSVADPNRLSCLGFIRKAKAGYPMINLIEDIKFLKFGTFDTGDLYFTFLPHITRAVLHNHIKDKKIDEKTTTQQYIEDKCNRILTKVGQGSQHIVFSHLNVHGAHGGSEENLLKKSEAFLPKAFTNTPLGFVEPTIIQAHIHSNQIVDNIYIVGSPIYCSFGETGEKFFCEVTHSGNIGENEDNIEFIKLDATPFMQLELNMIGETRDFFEIEEVIEFCNSITSEDNPIVKLDVTINPENNTYDWKKIREEIAKYNVHCKPITPRIVFKRLVRSVDQKLNLEPKKAVQVYLKKNFKKDKTRMKRLYALSLKYLGE